MALETIPGSVQTLENLLIIGTPTAANPLSVAALVGGTAKSLTYSLTPDGWDFPITESEIEDARLTAASVGSVMGRTKYGPINVTYVHGSGSDVAKAFLTPGTTVNLTIRDSISNATVPTIAQKADTVKVTCGKFRKVYSGDLQVIQQTLYVVAGSYVEGGTLVA